MSYKLATAFVELAVKGQQQLGSALEGIKGQLLGAFSAMSSAFGADLFNVRDLSSAVTTAIKFTDAAVEARKGMIQLDSIIAATGGTAKVTSEEVAKLASDMQDLTTLDDDDIVRAAKNLMIFDKVAGDTFKRTLKAAGDLEALGLSNLESATMRIGRALQDPARGARALRTLGAIFTQEETKKLAALQASNRMLEAQDMILKKIEHTSAGAAEAFGKTQEGRWMNVRRDIANINEALGGELLPIMVEIGDAFVRTYRAAADFLKPLIKIGSVAFMLADIQLKFMTLGFDLPKIIALLTPGEELMKRFADAGKKVWQALITVRDAAANVGVNIIQAFGTAADTVLKVFGTSLDKLGKDFLDWTVNIVNWTAEFVLDQAEWFNVMVNKWDEAMFAMSIDPLIKAKRELERNRPDFKKMFGIGPDGGGKIIHELKLDAGFVGFADASKKLQEAILKAEAGDPQTKMAAGIMNLNEVANKQLQEAMVQTKLLADKPKVA